MREAQTNDPLPFGKYENDSVSSSSQSSKPGFFAPPRIHKLRKVTKQPSKDKLEHDLRHLPSHNYDAMGGYQGPYDLRRPK